ncbi:MAG: hypothetical protein HY549_00190 [Elusimicrobia bacterium]|nr:hypothetical protein [Elusimicrobiota bacterium]
MNGAFLTCAMSVLASAAWAQNAGVLLLAHGGQARWNKDVAAVRDGLDRNWPAEVAFGMADVAQIQAAIDRLEKRGVDRVIAVPLFVNSSSEVMEHTRYVLGLKREPSQILRDAMAFHSAHMHGHRFSLGQVSTDLPILLTAALDDHPLIGDILAERAKTLSRDPSRETVILVGHGPVDDKADPVWLSTMESLAKRVGSKAGFKAAFAATIRDDSPAEVKERASVALRKMVAEASKDGEAIVVPLLIARGGIESRISRILKGQRYRWDGSTLLPHPNVERWAIESVKAAIGGN